MSRRVLKLPESLSLEDFSRQYGDEDFRLRYKRAKGEVLTQDELADLAELNAWLDKKLPKPERTPEHIRKLVDDILSRPEP